jgi:transposase-like protein
MSGDHPIVFAAGVESPTAALAEDWTDGIYSGLRAEQQRLCVLVVVGVNERGEKHFLAIEDGVRESTQNWRELLLGLKHRGLNVPQLAVGDGALGFCAALDEVFPAPHWQHLRTTNPIESTFATIRHRTARTKGCVTRDSMLHMMFKLGECAEKNWRRLRGFAYLAKVIDGVKFVNGEELQQPNQDAA